MGTPERPREERRGALAGYVYLVGAGPGDPGLLTARALELIASADVILYDRLIAPAALEGARAGAELTFVGKQGRGPSVPQAQTEALMVARAQAGKAVVRLKGGDPFVFGRGGEEALTLRAAGIPYEVVPGITAGPAAAACAGIPVTHRGLASAVAFVTGHEDPDKQELALDWQALAAFPGTLVFYMGVRRLGEIAASLIAAGRSPSEPAAVVEAGTLPTQRIITASLQAIAQRASGEDVRAPAITVVGDVVALGERLSWLKRPPLAGRTVAVTRARAQASELARRLRALGASVVQAPVIRIRPLPGPPLDPSPYDLLCLTSPNAVPVLFERLAAGNQDARALAGTRVAVIGPATAAALARHGILADVMPEEFVAEALVQVLADAPVRRALVARASQARDVLPDALRARGAEVDVLALYETVLEPLAPHTLAAARAADYLTFTSSSTVRYFLQAALDAGQQYDEATHEGAESAQAGVAATRQPLVSAGTRIVSIGPVTSQTLQDNGLQADVEATRHDVDGLIDALLADVAGRAD